MKPIVLVVEDNERNRKLVRVLEFRGFEVVECDDGVPSLGLAKQHRPALVLMDIQMPVMDGITALKHLRADAETAPIPVIAVTASVTPGEREKVESAGFNGYLGKPIDINAFNEMVDRVTGRKGEAA